MQEGTVVRWLKAEGSNVDLGEPVAEIETDKAVVEFESYASGVLQRILVAEGSTVPVGETIALVGEAAVVAPPAPEPDPEPVAEADAAADDSAPESAAAEGAGLGEEVSAAIPLGAASEPPAVDVQPAPAAPAAVETPPPARRVLATPIARQMARDAGVDLADIAGSGPGGRIVREDVAAAIEALRAAEAEDVAVEIAEDVAAAIEALRAAEADAAAVEVAEEEPAPEPPVEEPAAESAPDAEESAEEPVSDEEPVEAVGESEDEAESAPEPQPVADEADEADDGEEPVAEAASDEEPEAAAEESEPAAEPEEEGEAAAVAIAVAASDEEGDVAVSVEIAVAVSDDEDDEADDEEEPEPAMTGEIIVSVPDVGEAEEEPEPEAAADASDEEAAPEPVAADDDDGLLPLSRTRQQIARVTIRSKSEKPHFYVNADVDMTAAMALRAQINEALASDGVRVTVNDMIIAASVIALRRFPKFNAYYEDGGIRMNDGVNVGVAMAVGEGLIMPAIVGADGMSLKEIARASKDLSERSQRGALSAPEYSGGTFAISNMGMLGVTSFVAIIQPPQTAVLAIGAVQKRAVVTDDDQIAIRQMMTATLSADHRIVDGAEGAMFVNEIKSLLENPLSVIL